MYQYFTETGASFQEALEKIKAKYGASAQILSQRTVYEGGFLGFFSKEAVEISGCLRHDLIAQEKSKLEEEKKKILALAQTRAANEERDRKEKEDSLKTVLAEMQELKKQMQELPRETQTRMVEHPHLDKLTEILEANEFSREYIRWLLGRVKKDFSLQALDDWATLEATVVEWISQSLQIYQDKPVNGPRVFILVGPTGVGKTTTIAKLAAGYRLGVGGADRQSVSMITIDNYRIGAKVQIESYGQIMEIPVASPDSYEDLAQRIRNDRESDIILVDTIGKSPKDFLKLAEMRQLLEACGKNSEVHLAVSATTKTKDVKEIFQQFEPFGYLSVVLTKLDETSAVGNFISLLWEKGKPLSFITDGQAVPADIHRASRDIILDNLTGFHPDTIKKISEDEQGKKG